MNKEQIMGEIDHRNSIAPQNNGVVENKNRIVRETSSGTALLVFNRKTCSRGTMK